jgi:hypothetical protein
MGLATPPLPPIFSHSKTHHSISIPEKSNSSNSMSQDYHHGIFSFSNGFDRSAVSHQDQQHHHHHHPQAQQHHIAQQIRRDKLRVQGFEAPPPQLVGIDEEESGGLPVYETAGMLSEMFNFPHGGATAADLLEQPMAPNYRSPRPQPAVTNEWYGNRQGMVVGLGPLGDAKNQNSVNSRDSLAHQPQPQHHHHHHGQISSINAADSAAAMQLFLMNPQPRSPSPPPPPTSSTLHMLLPNPSTSLQGFAPSGAAGGAFGQFTWVNSDSGHDQGGGAAAEIGGVVEGQGLSLSLSSSLQHLEAAKAEELRMGDGGILYYNQGAGGSSSSQYYKPLHLQGVGHQNNQVPVGFGSSLGVVNVLRNSKYEKAAQELLEEFCSVGRGQFKKNKFGRHNANNPSSNQGNSGAGSSSTSKDLPPLSAADRIEHQRRKVKLLSMLDEACNLTLSHLLSPLKSRRSQSFGLFIYSIIFIFIF